MMKCPNCNTELADNVTICPQCGNPLYEGRPWEKKSKAEEAEMKSAIAEAEEKRNEGKNLHEPHARVKTDVKKSGAFGNLETDKEIKNSFFRVRFKKPINTETFLKNKFVVDSALCSYTFDLDCPECMESGTMILTKDAIYFGKSEYDIGCGKYKIEIPTEIVDYFTEAKVDGKKCFMLHTVYGERFFVYVLKKKDWQKNFAYLLPYTHTEKPENHRSEMAGVFDPEDPALLKMQGIRRWVTAGGSLILATMMFAMPKLLNINSMLGNMLTFASFFFMIVSISTFGNIIRNRK